MPSKNIVASGGGGFGRSLGSLEIEKYIVSLSNKKRPKICFIPTASGDSSLFKLNFYRAFSKLDCITSHIDFFSRTENLEEKVLAQDIIYVGGGDTKQFLKYLGNLSKEVWTATFVKYKGIEFTSISKNEEI